jgi:hypothetical protein
MSAAATKTGLFDCRDAYVATLEALGAENDSIVAVVNDSVGSSKLGKFREKFPERLINVGIAEQTMVGVGAGLANGGKVAFVSGASCFLTGRSLEQVKADVAYSQANVKLCGISSGVAYGELGPTHHSIEDVAWLRTMGSIDIIVPADPGRPSRPSAMPPPRRARCSSASAAWACPRWNALPMRNSRSARPRCCMRAMTPPSSPMAPWCAALWKPRKPLPQRASTPAWSI